MLKVRIVPLWAVTFYHETQASDCDVCIYKGPTLFMSCIKGMRDVSLILIFISFLNYGDKVNYAMM